MPGPGQVLSKVDCMSQSCDEKRNEVGIPGVLMKACVFQYPLSNILLMNDHGSKLRSPLLLKDLEGRVRGISVLVSDVFCI